MEYSWPIPVTKELWKVKCGGVSKEIAPYAGINKEALIEKKLPQKAKIEVREYKQYSFESSIFQLQALDDSTPQALQKSTNGELVLPKKTEKIVRRPKSYYSTSKGKTLVIHVLEDL